VWLWAWEKTITKKRTMSYVIMFGYGKGLTHCKYVVMFGYGRGLAPSNAHIWVGLTIFQRTDISKMQIKNCLFGYGGLGSH